MVKDKECYCCLLPRSLPSGLGNLVDTFSNRQVYHARMTCESVQQVDTICMQIGHHGPLGW